MTASDTAPRQRRRRGEARQLLIDAAVELFNEKGYSAPTREIAERANVSETLIFRHFGTKAGLFREAMITPFAGFVERFVAEIKARDLDGVDAFEMTKVLVGGLYDLFTTHRGLVAILWAGTTHEGSDLVETGLLGEAWRSFDRLDELGKQVGYGGVGRDEIATRAVVSMVAGMAVANRTASADEASNRSAVIEEMARICVYGYTRPL